MKIPRFASPLLLAAAVLVAVLSTSPTASAQTTDPAKVAELKSKYMAGSKLLEEGKPMEALELFNEVLEAEPKARGSLVKAAVCNLQLARYSKAIDLLNRFRALEPNDPNGLVMLIPAYEAINKSKEAEEMVNELKKLRASGTVPALSQEDFFLRERIIRPDGSRIELMEAYDYRKKPYIYVMARQMNPQNQPTRQLIFQYDPDASKVVAEKDPKLKGAQVFFLMERTQGGKVNIYRQLFGKPPYDKISDWMTSAILVPPTPISVGEMKDGKLIFPQPKLK